MNALTKTFTAGFALSALTLACAGAMSPPPHSMESGHKRLAVVENPLARLSVVDRSSGRSLPVFWHHGTAYVVGEPGMRYGVEIASFASERLLAVTAVDGINIVSGQSFSPAQSGYVFSAGQRYQVNGWRKSDSQVAAFEFAALSQSYAARTGRPDGVGEIRVALFRERPEVQLYEPRTAEPLGQLPRSPYSGRSADSAASRGAAASSAQPEAAAPAPGPRALAENSAAPAESSREMAKKSESRQSAERLGTAHGARETQSVARTSFERMSAYPDQVLVIRYDSYQNLLAQGVIDPHSAYAQHWQRKHCEVRPSRSGYAPDPRAGC